MTPKRYISFVDPYYLSLLDDRYLSWSRIYQSLLGDDRFNELEDNIRFYLMGLLLLANKHQNKIPASRTYLQYALRSTEEIRLGPLVVAKIIQLYNQDGEVLKFKNKRRYERIPHQTYVDVFTCWKTVHKHDKAHLDAKRQLRIRTAIRLGYSPDDIIEAIKGCKLSAFHMGENESRKKYDSLDLILRDADHIDNFISLYRADQKKNENCTSYEQRLEEYNRKMRLETDRKLGLID